MKDAAYQRMKERVAEDLVQMMMEHYFVHGELTKDDLNDKKELLKKFRQLHERDKKTLRFVTDYRRDIINQARQLYKDKEYNFSKILFATFFEHSINALIDHVGKRKGIEEKYRLDIIRTTNLTSKLTWVFKLLGLKPLNKKYLKTINLLAEQRNAFVHYKWNDTSTFDFSSAQVDAIETAFNKEIMKAVGYMNRYESLVMFDKAKKKVLTVF